MWLEPSLCPDTTAPCLNDKCDGKSGKTVDGVTEGELQSETEKKELFHNVTRGSLISLQCDTPQYPIGISQGVTSPFICAKMFKMAQLRQWTQRKARAIPARTLRQ